MIAGAVLGRSTFWDEARAQLDGLPEGRGLNIAHEAVDRHASGTRADQVAIRWLGKRGATAELTYAELAAQTNRFANVLQTLGVGRGSVVATLLGRVPELYVTVLGTLKSTSVVTPLFSAFGPEPVWQRLHLGGAHVLVTTELLYRRKVLPIRDRLPDLEHVLLVGPGADGVEGTQALEPLMAAASDRFEIPPTDPEDPALRTRCTTRSATGTRPRSSTGSSVTRSRC